MSLEPAIPLDDIPVGTATAIELGDKAICLVRVDDSTVKAVLNVCSHAQYALDDGLVDIDGDTASIECSLHGSMFDLDTGQPDSFPAVKPIPTYATAIKDGHVMVDASAPTNGASQPRHS